MPVKWVKAYLKFTARQPQGNRKANKYKDLSWRSHDYSYSAELWLIVVFKLVQQVIRHHRIGKHSQAKRVAFKLCPNLPITKIKLCLCTT